MTGEQWLAMLDRSGLTEVEWDLMCHGELTMDESKWATCSSPAVLLRFVWFELTARKKELYFCGGCSRMKHLYYHPLSLKYLDVAERGADGLADSDELRWADYGAEGSAFGYHYEREFWDDVTVDREKGISALIAAGLLNGPQWGRGEWVVDQELVDRTHIALNLLSNAFTITGKDFLHPFEAKRLATPDWPGRWLSDCIFGNPFRPVAADPGWLTPTAVAIAESIYKERAFDRLPILADALEEAGCADADVLLHCREPGEHVRGCWVVDLVLGKG